VSLFWLVHTKSFITRDGKKTLLEKSSNTVFFIWKLLYKVINSKDRSTGISYSEGFWMTRDQEEFLQFPLRKWIKKKELIESKVASEIPIKIQSIAIRSNAQDARVESVYLEPWWADVFQSKMILRIYLKQQGKKDSCYCLIGSNEICEGSTKL